MQIYWFFVVTSVSEIFFETFFCETFSAAFYSSIICVNPQWTLREVLLCATVKSGKGLFSCRRVIEAASAEPASLWQTTTASVTRSTLSLLMLERLQDNDERIRQLFVDYSYLFREIPIDRMLQMTIRICDCIERINRISKWENIPPRIILWIQKISIIIIEEYSPITFSNWLR